MHAGPKSLGALRLITWILAPAPLCLLLSVLLHACSMYLHLGRWPVVYRDEADTSFLLAVERFGLVYPSLYGALLGVPTWVACAVTSGLLRVLRPQTLFKQLVVVVAGVVGLFLLITYDSTGYAEWFFD